MKHMNELEVCTTVWTERVRMLSFSLFNIIYELSQEVNACTREPFECESWTYHELLSLYFHSFLFAWGQANIQVWGYLIRENLACIFSTIHAWFWNILDVLHKLIRILDPFLNYWPCGKLMCFQILGYWVGRIRQ